MSIHIRDAYEEVLDLLNDPSLILPLLRGGQTVGVSLPLNKGESERGCGVRGVIHCYTGDWETAKKFLDLGFYLGFTGVITFPARKTNPKATADLLEVVQKCPLDRMLVETDAPYLAPQAYRGKKCEPWMVEEVVKKIAEMRGKSFEEMIRKTEDNTKMLFFNN